MLAGTGKLLLVFVLTCLFFGEEVTSRPIQGTCDKWNCTINGETELCARNGLQCCLGSERNFIIRSGKRRLEKCCFGATNPVYSLSTQLCSGKKVIPKTKGLEKCCEDVVYRPDTEECLEKQNPFKCHVQPKGFDSASPQLPSYILSHTEDKNVGNEFGGRPENQSTCGGEEINPESDLCCDDVVYRNERGIFECCEAAKFNPITQDCCLNGPQPKGIDICGENVVSEDPGTCGGQAMNQESDLCCDAVLYPGKRGKLQCCEAAVIDPREIVCCQSGPRSKMVGCGDEDEVKQVIAYFIKPKKVKCRSKKGTRKCKVIATLMLSETTDDLDPRPPTLLYKRAKIILQDCPEHFTMLKVWYLFGTDRPLRKKTTLRMKKDWMTYDILPTDLQDVYENFYWQEKGLKKKGRRRRKRLS